jgi:hypothetical protein
VIFGDVTGGAALFSLEPRYVMGSGAENNPKFPAAPGPAPTARFKGDEP